MSWVFFPSYCIIIIINKKERTTEDFSCADVSFYAYNHSIRPFPWPLLKTALRCERAEVLCQGQEWQQTHVCSPVNITPTEMWEEKRIWRGPCRSATRLLGRPFECSTDDQVVLYCIIGSRVSREEYVMYSASVTSENTLEPILDRTSALQVPSWRFSRAVTEKRYFIKLHFKPKLKQFLRVIRHVL